MDLLKKENVSFRNNSGLLASSYLKSLEEPENLEEKILTWVKEISKKDNLRVSIEDELDLVELTKKVLNVNSSFLSREGVDLVSSGREFLEVARLRHKVYSEVGYSSFFEVDNGFLYDAFDERSFVLRYKRKDEVSGSISLIVDLPDTELKSEDENLDFNFFRGTGRVAELNRLVIDKKYRGNKGEFRELYRGVYDLAMKYNIDYIFLVISSDHFGIYERFGGVSLIDRVEEYKGLKQKSDILCWEPKKSTTNTYFAEKILGNKRKKELLVA